VLRMSSWGLCGVLAVVAMLSLVWVVGYFGGGTRRRRFSLDLDEQGFFYKSHSAQIVNGYQTAKD
jgi:hypothetical protein